MTWCVPALDPYSFSRVRRRVDSRVLALQVGGMPTRFRYTKVEPQTFGLTPAEILTATDAELNTFMGIKKYAPYRKEGKGRTWDGQRVARLQELKSKLKERGVDGALQPQEERVKKRKGKKERMREKAAAAASGHGGDDEDDGSEVQGEERRPKDKKRKRDAAPEQGEDQEAEHDGADEGTKKKRRRHRKHAAAAAS